MTPKRLLPLLISVMLLMLGESAALACPNCGDGLAADPAQAGLVRGLFWSILFLLSMPFLITAGMGSYFYYQIRKARRTGSPFRPNAAPVERELESVGH